MSTLVTCPEPLRWIAKQCGVHDDDLQELWDRHRRMVDEEGGEYGGHRWKGLCTWHAKRPRIPTVRRDDPVMAAARKAEREAQRVEALEYDKVAVSLQDWLADLRVREDFFEAVSPLEGHLAAFRDPLPGEQPVTWLYAALDGYLSPGRRLDCGMCGGEPATHVVGQRVYRAGLCVPCAEKFLAGIKEAKARAKAAPQLEEPA